MEDKHLTTIMIVLNRSGAEYTNDMNIPLESKYWNLENDLKIINHNPVKRRKKVCRSKGLKKPSSYLQFMAATSFTYSALYTIATKDIRIILVLNLLSQNFTAF